MQFKYMFVCLEEFDMGFLDVRGLMVDSDYTHYRC